MWLWTCGNRWWVVVTGLVVLVEVAMSLASYERDREKEALKKKKEIIFKRKGKNNRIIDVGCTIKWGVKIDKIDF